MFSAVDQEIDFLIFCVFVMLEKSYEKKTKNVLLF